MVRCAFAVLFILAVTSLFGQNFSKTQFTVSRGLPRSMVSSLCEDTATGYLWVATEGGGLARFDGRTFVTYSLAEGLFSNTIYKIFIDRRGRIWAATRRGISRFDGLHFKNFYRAPGIFDHFAEYGDTLYALSRDRRLTKIVGDSVVVVGSPGQAVREIFSESGTRIYQLDENNILTHRERGDVRKVNLSALGTIYNLFAFEGQVNIVSESGAYRWNADGLQLVDAQINFPIVVTDRDFKVTWAQRQNRLAKLVRDPVLVYVDTIPMKVRVRDAITDLEGNTWFGTEGNGLIKYSRQVFELMRTGAVTAITANDQALWVATREHGLEVIAPKANRRHVDMGYHAHVAALRRDAVGDIWAGGSFGMIKIDHQGHLQFPFDDGRIGPVATFDFDDAQQLWIGARKGLFCGYPEPGGGYRWSDNLFPEWILKVAYIPAYHRVLLATVNGISQMVNGRVSRLPTLFDSTGCSALTPYKDKFAVMGSIGRGFALHNFETGVTRYYSKKDGLASDLIYFLKVDDKNHLWIGSDQGIERVGFDEHLDLQEYLHFTEEHGLEGQEASVSFFEGDEKYFGTAHGLYHFSGFDHAGLWEHPLHFTNVQLVNTSASLTDYANDTEGFFHIPQHPVLPYNRNSIRFSFAKVFKKYPGAISYKFILEGHDTEWSTATSGGEETYQNLAPGDYVFKIVARDVNGYWSKVPLEYAFLISPPYYLRLAFFVPVLLGILALLGVGLRLYFRYRVAQHMKQEQLRQSLLANLRKEIAIDFHDSMGNQLARIINFVGLSKINPVNAPQLLSQIEETTKNLIGGTRDFIWALDRKNDSSENLFVHLKDFADRLFSEKAIAFRAFYRLQEDLLLPIGIGRQINLILKEAVTNAFKHSQADQVTLQFEKLNSELIISLIDNGIGIAPEKRSDTCAGMTNMNLRAKRINATLSVSSSAAGTKISLSLNTK